jgi:hypothetical protein
MKGLVVAKAKESSFHVGFVSLGLFVFWVVLWVVGLFFCLFPVFFLFLSCLGVLVYTSSVL